MAEVLTESFCERCGTRYTFESSKPRVKRLKGVKVLSRGLKNFVLSDDSSLDEAMAAARSDTDREVTSQQLDAFHKTFNFCMTCRQYTCANCWNEAEGTCLTCSPHLGHEIMPAPFPDLDPLGLTVALGAADVAMPNGASAANGNGNGHVAPEMGDGAWPTSDAWPSHDVEPVEDGPVDAAPSYAAGEMDEIDVEARMAALTAIGSGSAATPEPVAEAIVEPELIAEAVEVVAEPELVAEIIAEPELVAEVVAEPEAVAEVIAEPEALAEVVAEVIAEPDAVAEVIAEPEPVAEVIAEPEPVAEPAIVAEAEAVEIAAALAVPDATPVEPLTSDQVAAAATAQTAALLGRFRPGQNLDAEIAAYERDKDLDERPIASSAPPAEPVVVGEVIAAALIVSEPEPVHVEAEPEPELLAAEPEPEPVQADREPEPEVVAGEPEPIAPDHEADLAAAAAAAALVAAATRPADIVAQPTWQIVAPDSEQPQTTPTPTAPPAPAAPTIPAPQPNANAARPEWPANPEWPTQTPSAGLPFLGRLAQPTGGLDSLWAESSREVASAAPAPGRPAQAPAGVQPCVSCGLSLSATARFCRRCGTSQHA